MCVIRVVECSEIPLTTLPFGKDRTQIGGRTLRGRLLSRFDRFFAALPDEYSIEAALDQPRDRNPERIIQPDDCFCTRPDDVLHAGIRTIQDPGIALTCSVTRREKVCSGQSLLPDSRRRESMQIPGTPKSSEMRLTRVVFPTPVEPKTIVRLYGNLFCPIDDVLLVAFSDVAMLLHEI